MIQTFILTAMQRSRIHFNKSCVEPVTFYLLIAQHIVRSEKQLQYFNRRSCYFICIFFISFCLQVLHVNRIYSHSLGSNMMVFLCVCQVRNVPAIHKLLAQSFIQLDFVSCTIYSKCVLSRLTRIKNFKQPAKKTNITVAVAAAFFFSP